MKTEIRSFSRWLLKREELKMYTPTKVVVPEKTHEKLKNAVSRGNPTSIRIRLNSEKSPEQTLLLTNGQLDKIYRAKVLAKKYITLRMSR